MSVVRRVPLSAVAMVGVLVVAPTERAPSAGSVCEGEARWSTLALEHVARYEGLELTDLYKLLHQATMGSEHVVLDVAGARDWLAREIAELGDGPAEPLVDRLGADGAIVRVHLRPFLTRGHDPERLIEAFGETASGRYADRAAIGCALNAMRNLASEGKLPWDVSAVDAYLETRDAAGHDAVHHSDAYAGRYRPAYRVVARELVPETWLGEGTEPSR